MPTFHRLLQGTNSDGPPPSPAVLMSKFGPYVELVIACPASVNDRRRETFVKGLGLIDTGAHSTVVSSEAMAQLGLQPVGKAEIVGAGAGSATVDQFECEIHFPFGGVPKLVLPRVSASPLADTAFVAMLGRDFLADKLLILDGKAGYYTLAW